MMLSLEKEHEGQVQCLYCREWIEKEFVINRRCPSCYRRIERVCVICGKSFFSKDIGTRIVCYNPECLKVFRYHCGKGDRFWSKKERKADVEKKE